jgi:putative membrane protein
MKDREFVIEAAQNDFTEVELGRLGSIAEDERVRDLAKHLVEEHERANRQLLGLAKTKSLKIPTEIDTDRRALIDRLANLSGADFRREYIKAVLQNHQRSISIFQQESQTGEDKDFRDFAARQLPTLQAHFRMAKAISAW